MAWSRRWRINSLAKWRGTLRALLEQVIDFEASPVELVVREELREKSDGQRRLFHAICGDLAILTGDTPGGVKRDIKALYFGEDVEHWSTEDLDHQAYGHLIETVYVVASEMGFYIPDRR